MNIEPHEQKRIEKFGFIVTMTGNQFVVRHPKLKRVKHEGGNLSAMLTAAEMDLEERAKKDGAAKPAKKEAAAKPASTKSDGAASPAPAPTGPIASDKAKAAAAKAAKRAKGGTTGGTTIAEAVAGQGGTQPAASTTPKPVRAVKRSQGDWKTYQIGKLILRNPDKTPEEILALCKEQKIDTKVMTVVGLTRYFRLCIKVLADITAEDQVQAAADG